ncbi:MAG: FHA domain-containing protein [Myxococcales bacterium]|nr:FHA domain-containing protein [Myxococcales bacterium]
MLLRPRYWLVLTSGERFAITASGVMIGRSSRCDVVIDDSNASRRQAIVVDGDAGPVVVSLGRAPTVVNGVEVDREQLLADGAELRVPGLVARIVSGMSGILTLPAWVVRTDGGARFGIARSPFVIGGSAAADLRITGWPSEVARFTFHDELSVLALVPLELDGRPLAAGARVALTGPATIACAGIAVEVRPADGEADGDGDSSGDLARLLEPSLAVVEFLPRGGRLTVSAGGRKVVVYLAEKRCDLIAVLLQPPAPHVPGEFISDEVILPRLWPGRVMSRVDLNTLLHRTRADITQAGLPGAAILQRAPGGNATRFVLAPGATVRFE